MTSESTSAPSGHAGTPTAKQLEIAYEGYFMCRLPTDPDPSNDGRGMSGYTMALATEDQLDQVIRLQVTQEFLAKNGRVPLADLHKPIGVNVTGVKFNGKRCEAAEHVLCGAKVHLDGKDYPARGPVFESRNNITGSDDTMAMVVTPFQLRIEHPGVRLTAIDHLNPAAPEQQIWQIFDPSIYQRRLTLSSDIQDTEVAEATNVYDCFGYLRDRRRYLEKLIADGAKDRAECAERVAKAGRAAAPSDVARLAMYEGYESRIYQIELWGDRVSNKLQMKAVWQFNANGQQTAELPAHVGTLDTTQPWAMRFWFGGWDGDLMIGYMRGTLSAPFTPAKP